MQKPKDTPLPLSTLSLFAYPSLLTYHALLSLSTLGERNHQLSAPPHEST